MPEQSHEPLSKNSCTVKKLELAIEFSVPLIVLVVPVIFELVMAGKFCRLFGALITVARVVRRGSSACRTAAAAELIPRPPFPKIEFCVSLFPVW